MDSFYTDGSKTTQKCSVDAGVFLAILRLSNTLFICTVYDDEIAANKLVLNIYNEKHCLILWL